MTTRVRTSLPCLILIFAPWFPAVAKAQFQPPNPEELQMTSDPKAPGAAAVYLEVRESDNDPIHFQQYYERIKVLTEKGKDLATVQVPYGGSWKVKDIKGRTIHSDGTIIPLNGKPEDLLFVKKGDEKIGRKVFTLPSVEVGSVIEYQYELQYDDQHFSSPLWDIQRTYFVHKAHYDFVPYKNFWPGATELTSGYDLSDERGRVVHTLMWWPILPKGVEVAKSMGGHYSVDLTDIPPAPHEEYMPPEDAFLYKVYFYYMYTSNPNEFWMGEAKYWMKDVDHFAEPSKAIKAAVDGIVAAGDSTQEKAKKLYDAVQKLDNTDFSREKSESERKALRLKNVKRAEDTWNQKSGSSEDIALLYLAMLRAAGLTAYPMKVVDRTRGIFDMSYMSFSQLDDTLVVLDDGGKETYLDPGEKMCPFGRLNWNHAEVKGIRQSSQGFGLVGTPPQTYVENTTTRNADLTIDPQGAITGSFTFVINGQAALDWRQRALENDMDEVKKQFDREMEKMIPDGMEAHVDHFLGMDSPDTNLIAIVTAKGSIGTAAGKRLLLPGFLFESRGNTPFVDQEKRLEPVDMHYPERITDSVTYHLPPGVSVEGAPQDDKVVWANHAMLIVKSQTSPDQLIIADSVARNFSTAKPEEYQDLRGFYQKVAATDQEQLVLTSATAAKGN
ncbi:MAG TPA: DUF3857 and transglutaminase domain-containing protein [Terracidiphilus sp.]|nr:DUF3857 and transglutaminase domain-containing protein [Terracidiphilus sp.]